MPKTFKLYRHIVHIFYIPIRIIGLPINKSFRFYIYRRRALIHGSQLQRLTHNSVQVLVFAFLLDGQRY